MIFAVFLSCVDQANVDSEIILLAAPIGNSELERSFSLMKRTSLDPHRQTASSENKAAMNKAHVNKDLHLVP